MELQVVRTIHPVGQGAFYTETLHRPGMRDDKHVVYDCGVLPFSNRLVEEVGNFLPKNSTIDILFISHFHADHVNGLKLLSKSYKIKHVVLPQIDDYEWFYIIENYLTVGNVDVGIITDVRSTFGEATIIQVAPRVENGEEVVSEESIDLGGREGIIINGLIPLVINQDFALWHFVVVNSLLKGDLEALKTAIQDIDYNGRKVSIDDLHNPGVLDDIRADLQAVYSKVFKGGNEYSMCMLSELANRKEYKSYSRFNMRNRVCMECYRSGRDCDGGLYCGDADFLHCDTLECLKRRLRGREENVGLLQIPHHGSKKNFNIDLLNWLGRIRVSFACFGSPNRYNHPSSDVMGIAGTYSYTAGVNQFKSNVLTERIDVEKREG